MLDPHKLRDAFERKRYGGAGEYDPDFDLFDAAATEIERLRAALAELIEAADASDLRKQLFVGREIINRARKALSDEQSAPSVGGEWKETDPMKWGDKS